MKNLPKLGLLVALLMISLSATAYDFEVEDIYYDVDPTSEFCCKVNIGDNPYSGKLSIPEQVEYDGTLYTVTGIISLGENSLSEIVIPASIISIENFAFNKSSYLKRVVIENSKIPLNIGYAYYTPSDNRTGYGIFYYCPLEYIYIGRPMKYKVSSEYGCGPIGYHRTLKFAELGGKADCGLEYNYNLFYNIPTLEKIVIGGNITSILNLCSNCPNVSLVEISAPIINMNNAFSGCEKLETIVLGNEVREMQRAFAGCISLKKVNIPDGVKDLSSTFSGCSSLATINLPESVENLDYTFWKCSNLTGVIVPSSVQKMKETFYNCAQLTTVNIPDGVKDLSNTFCGCSSLSSIDIPGSVSNLNNTFYNCTSLKHVTIPQSVSSLNCTFAGCSQLESVDIPQGISNLNETFRDCSNITSISLPEGIISLGKNTFSGCANLNSLTLPSSLTDLGQSCFSDCSSLQSIDIPTGVKELGKNVFTGWTGLKTLHIPGNVTSIGLMAFGQGVNIEELIIDETEAILTLDGAEDNGKCRSVLTLPGINKLSVGRPVEFKRSVSYPGGSTIYPPLSGVQAKQVIFFGHAGTSFNQSLADCKNLETVIFDGIEPQNLDYMLSGCESIKSFKIPESAISIKGLFYGATYLTETTIPSGITSLRYTFNRCSSLSSIQIPESVIDLDFAFSGCTSLQNIDIPSSVTSMQSAFSDCQNLRNINVPENTENMRYSFANCISLEKAFIPQTVTDDYMAYKGCSSLKSIFVDNQSALGSAQYTFDDNLNLEKLTIGSHVSKVGTDLSAVDNIMQIECLGHIPPVGYSNSFSRNVYENCKLIVPQNTREQYINYEPWRYFINITDKDTSGIDNNYVDSMRIMGIFNLNGVKLDSDLNSLPSGIYIVKYNNGEYFKIIH